jgi:cytochrome P450
LSVLPDEEVAEIDFGVSPYEGGEIPDLYEHLAALRENRGVARLRMGPDTGFVLLRYRDIYDAIRDETRYSKSEAFRPLTFPFMGPNIQGYDGAEHTVKRGLVSPAFRRTAIPRYIDPILRPTAEALVDDFIHRGEADLMVDFAKKYPMRITNQLLGIPDGDEERMTRWAVAMIGLNIGEETFRAKAEFTEYIEPLLEERRSRPGDDLLSALVTQEVDGQRLSDEEVLGFLRLLFPAGVDTTWLALGSLMFAVLDNPQHHERLLHDADERAWAVEETLRWESPVGLEPRMTLADMEVSGVEIPARSMVRLCLPAANRDPDEFPDPDRWDLDRRPTTHIAFGLGRHFCLGAFLARAELAVGMEVLLQRLPNLRLAETPRMVGLILRGPEHVRVAFDAP